MIAENLKNTFDQYYPLPASFWESLEEAGEFIEVNAETIIKDYDSTECFLNYIVRGSGGILLWKRNNFICSDLVFENDFLCDYYSFITQQPTPYQVITFEKSLLFRISYSKLTVLTGEGSFYGDKFWRYATTALFIEKHQQYIQLSTYTAAEIYEMLLIHQPFIIKRIPQKFIASYLGITPQSLSRIRNGAK